MIPSVNRQLTRRDALRLGAAAALCVAAGRKAAASEARKKIPIGLQLYSVRGECEKDLPRVLEAVAKMGYEAVEFAGYYGRDAKQLRALLDENKLKCCGTHIGLETLLGTELEKTVAFNKILGNRFLIVPGLARKHTESAKAWLETAKTFNEIADELKPEGMRIGYHNHTEEFKPLDGKLPWDVFFGNTKPEVVMQFDTGNAMHAGAEALPFIKRYPGRALTVHVKAYSRKNPKALVGEDEIPWKDLFEALETVGGTEWYIVEYESDAYPPLESVDRCLKNLRKMGK